jgi:HAD superfamily hydrolase (TIGR01509 family)
LRTDKALIFDFNGTLFWDTEYHRTAWSAISERYRGEKLSRKESHHLNGRTNPETIAYLLGRTPTEAEVRAISEEKEGLYEQVCLANLPLSLAPGAVQLIEAAKQQDIPIAIATSAGEDNIRRYKQWFNLLSLFDEEAIIFDNGKRRSKPEPDIYRDACKTLGVEPRFCTVFEDTKAGILSACSAHVGSIIAVASPGSDAETIKGMDGVHALITDFSMYSLE